MKNKRIGNHSKEGYTSHKLKEAVHLYKKGDINNAKKNIFELLEINPNDKAALNLLYSCYSKEKDYQSIINLLTNPSFKEDDVFLKITAAAIRLNDEKLLMYLYDKYYYDYSLIGNYEEEHGHKYRIARYYLMRKFGPLYDQTKERYIENDIWHYDKDKTTLITSINTLKMTYREYQTWYYNEESAKNYIEIINGSENIPDEFENEDEDNRKVEKGYFNPNIDIEVLFHKLKTSIEYNKDKLSCKKMGDSYVFEYQNCGITKSGKICNHIVVDTTFNSSNIINMYPIVDDNLYNRTQISNITNLLDERLKHIKETKSKILKPKTGLERFNNKYNKQK